MLDVPLDRLVCEGEKIGDVGGHERSPLSRGTGELGSVVELDVADLVSAHRVDTGLSQELCDFRRKVLVEVYRHSGPTKRTSPGYRSSTASTVSAAFAWICRRISSGYRR